MCFPPPLRFTMHVELLLLAASKRASTHEKYKVGVRGEHHHRPDVTRILSCTLEFVSTPRNDSYIDMHVRKFCMQTIWPPRVAAGWLALLSLYTGDTRLRLESFTSG